MAKPALGLGFGIVGGSSRHCFAAPLFGEALARIGFGYGRLLLGFSSLDHFGFVKTESRLAFPPPPHFGLLLLSPHRSGGSTIVYRNGIVFII